MDLPRLMVSAAQEKDDSLLNAKIEDASKKLLEKLSKDKEKNKKIYNVLLILAPDKGKIRFEAKAWQDGDEKRYCYLGNNPSNSAQFYAVRKVNNFVNYWTGRGGGVLQALFDTLDEGELKEQLSLCKEKGLFSKEGLSSDHIAGWNPNIKVNTENKKFCDISNEKKTVGAENILMELLGLDTGCRLCLIIPCVRRQVISTHEEYRSKSEEKLLQDDTPTKPKQKPKQTLICHICGRRSETVDTVTYTKNLSRKSVSKVFVTTAVNYASDFKKVNHQQNFAVCRECYAKWLIGENTVMQDFGLEIAREKAVILFDGISDVFDRQGIEAFRQKIDAAFQMKELKEQLENLEDELDEQNIELFEFHLLFYKTDGKSCSVKKTIEAVSNIRFLKVMDAFQKVRRDYRLPNFKLKTFQPGTLYGLVPVHTNTKGEQLNIGRLLELYAAIFKGHTVSKHTIFEWYTEAMSCGNRYILSRNLRNEKNLLNLRYVIEKIIKERDDGKSAYRKSAYWREYYFAQMTFYYMAFLDVMRELEILGGDDTNMRVEQQKDYSELDSRLAKKESFLDKRQFTDTARGLFYLGAAMYQVGEMQREQDHGTKPILNKVPYDGMRLSDVLRFSSEIGKKIQQYRRAMLAKNKGLVYAAERYMRLAYHYLGDLPKQAEENFGDESANVFYLMSGYSSCICIDKKKTDDNQQEDKSNDRE